MLKDANLTTKDVKGGRSSIKPIRPIWTVIIVFGVQTRGIILIKGLAILTDNRRKFTVLLFWYLKDCTEYDECYMLLIIDHILSWLLSSVTLNN